MAQSALPGERLLAWLSLLLMIQELVPPPDQKTPSVLAAALCASQLGVSFFIDIPGPLLLARLHPNFMPAARCHRMSACQANYDCKRMWIVQYLLIEGGSKRAKPIGFRERIGSWAGGQTLPQHLE